MVRFICRQWLEILKGGRVLVRKTALQLTRSCEGDRRFVQTARILARTSRHRVPRQEGPDGHPRSSRSRPWLPREALASRRSRWGHGRHGLCGHGNLLAMRRPRCPPSASQRPTERNARAITGSGRVDMVSSIVVNRSWPLYLVGHHTSLLIAEVQFLTRWWYGTMATLGPLASPAPGSYRRCGIPIR